MKRMSKNILNNPSQEIKVSLTSVKPSFLMYPVPLFRIGHQFKWKARFLVGMGYLYALTYNSQQARTTVRELMKVLSTKSIYRVQEFLEVVETLNRYVVVEAEGEYPERFVRATRKGTEITLVNPMEFNYVERTGAFPVPKLAFLLPVSAQAKAVYIYLHYLRNKESKLARASVRKIAEAIRVTKNQVSDYTEELRRAGVLSTGQPGEFFVISPEKWPAEVFLKIRETYGEKHPFLREWEIVVEEMKKKDRQKKPPIEGHSDGCTNRPPTGVPIEGHSDGCTNRGTPGVPIEGQKSGECTNRGTPNVPIEGHSNPGEKRDTKDSQNPTTSITTSISNTTSIYDDINNGGVGEKQNIRKLSDSKRTIKERERISDSATREKSREESSLKVENSLSDSVNTAPPKKEPDGSLNNNKGAAELGKPNNSLGKLEKRIDLQELARIREVLRELRPEIERKFPSVFSEKNREGFEKFYGALKELYGEEWIVLAAMYELMSRKKPEFGYSRKANRNYLGLLISFALKDSGAHFDEFCRRFKAVFGIENRPRELPKERKEELPFTLERLKELLKGKLSPSMFKYFVDRGILSMREEDGVKVLKCRDGVVERFIARNLAGQFSEVLGEMGREWRLEH